MAVLIKCPRYPQAYTLKHLLKAHGSQTVTGGAIPRDKRWKALVEVGGSREESVCLYVNSCRQVV